MSQDPPTIWTLGHGARSFAELLGLLQAHGITRVVDVRRMPQSRRHPQFGRERLESSLAEGGVGYLHRPGLGGMRTPDGSETNAGIRESVFRGYADYMQTPSFQAEIASLIALASERPTAILCAESDPAHCHRSLIADVLSAQRCTVRHIQHAGEASLHALRAEAIVTGTRVTYPARQTELGLR